MTAPDDLNALARTWRQRWKGKHSDEYWALHRAAEDEAFDLGEHRSEVLALLREKDELQAQLASIKAGDSVVVPRVPTPEMWKAGAAAIDARRQDRAQRCWAAMLAAAPKETK